MNKQYTKESLDALGIFELRDYARNVGVDSPTTYNKDVLIEKILSILSGEAKPAPRSRRGRPPKPLGQNPLIGNRTQPPEVAPADPAVSAAPQAQTAPSEPVSLSAPQAPAQPAKNNNGNNGGNYSNNNNGNGNSGAHFHSRRNINNNNNHNSGSNNNSYDNQSNVFNRRNNGTAQIIADPGALNDYDDNSKSHEGTLEERVGVLEIHNDGYGFLRVRNYEPGDKDAYVSNQVIKRYGLRKGDLIKAQVRRVREDKQIAVSHIVSVNDSPPQQGQRRVNFDELTPIYPDKRFNLELPNSRHDIAIRSIDLIAPIGKGQRSMIVSPPKAGKTTLLKKIANSISINHPEAHLIVLLIDERPEEVTDMQRSIKGEVVYSTFDESPDHHTRAAELVLARAKRLVELNKDVVILLDSLTRLARAYNLTIPPTGRTLSGGIDPGALHSPKRFFGSARNIEHGGSLTIIATALIDTGSRMDDVIFEEFKGTGNMEIHLDRRLSEKRIFPAIDLGRSSTRREDLLLSQKELEGIWSVRKILGVGDTQESTENLINMMLKTTNNTEFIDSLQLWLKNL